LIKGILTLLENLARVILQYARLRKLALEKESDPDLEIYRSEPTDVGTPVLLALTACLRAGQGLDCYLMVMREGDPGPALRQYSVPYSLTIGRLHFSYCLCMFLNESKTTAT